MQEISIVTGRYPHTMALREGRVGSDLVKLRWDTYDPVNRAFAPMIRQQKFDVCEMALVVFLQAREFGKPLMLLPLPMAAEIHHHSLVQRSDRVALTPTDLLGKRVGIRAYSQTTGLWLRGALDEEFGIAHNDIDWVTLEPSHVSEYVDPDFVHRAPPGTTLRGLLSSGGIDAAVGVTGPRNLQTVIPSAHLREQDWFIRHGTVGLNHLVAISADLAEEQPQVVREIYRMFVESRQAVSDTESPATAAFPLPAAGLESVRTSIELAIEYALRQELISRPLSVNDLFVPHVED